MCITVLPSPSSLNTFSSISFKYKIFLSSKNILFPMSISLPSIFAITPFPSKVSKFSTSFNSIFFSLACFTTASANGCCEFFSTLAARLSNILSSIPMGIISVTCGFPLVRVPVLSNTIVESFSDNSSASPFFMRILKSAPRPMPTVTAVGVASPRAQGHAITRTEIKRVNAKSRV